LGSEADLTCSYKLNKQITIQVGYSQMIAGDSTLLLKGGSTETSNNWAYLMFSFKPNFYKN